MTPKPRPGGVAAASRPDLDWQEWAACRGEDPETFFAPDISLDSADLAELAEAVAERKRREAKAKSICSGCIVRVRCLEWRLADEHQLDAGVWGGKNEQEPRPRGKEVRVSTYALKAPAQSYKLPAWVTVHNAELAGAVLVIILLAFAVLRLAKAAGKASVPVPAPKKSGISPKFLLLAGLGGAGFWYWDTHLRHAAAAGSAKAAPAPSPSPHPVPTVTRTVAPHAAPHLTLPVHLTGGDVVAMFVIGGIVAIVIILGVLRRGDS
jgi:WhiB family redox-sensing transcriptional regulator